jgi:hypothetical protein
MSKRGRAKSSTVGSRGGTGRTGKALFGLVCACALALGAVLGSSASAAAAEACPNEQVRQESNSLALPSCRAYEQVSAVDKENSDAANGFLTGDLEHALYGAKGTFAGATRGGANEYLSTRTAAGWVTSAITPPLPPGQESSAVGVSFQGINADATSWLMQTGDPFDPGDTNETMDLYLRDADGRVTWVSQPEPGMPAPGYQAFFPGESTADLSHIVFQDTNKLTAAAGGLDTYAYGLYEWANGSLKLVNVDSSGALLTTYGAAFGSGIGSQGRHALSADGERIYFTTPDDVYAPPAPNNIKRVYLRQSGQTTTEVSASQCTEVACEGPVQDAIFQGASVDGSLAYFISKARLTNGATEGGGLYRFEANTGKLTLLTPDATDPGGAAVVAETLNSDDGSLVYFVAKGDLASGATAGKNNFYVYDARTSTTTFIATLLPSESSGVNAAGTPSAEQITFQSAAPLEPGFDNAGHKEIYLYDEPTHTLKCVSCLPAGAPAQGDSTLGVGARVHSISNDGSRIFFQSQGKLVSLDRNTKIDVYEWHNGSVSLISSGTSIEDSTLAGASASGSDVTFTTGSRLVPQDDDNQTDVYDARIGGGFPAPPVPAECTGTGCRGPLSDVPSLPGIGSSTVNSTGNTAGTQGVGKSCTKLNHGAKNLSRHAKQVRRRARLSSNPRVARQLKRKATRLSKQAASKRRAVKRCGRGTGPDRVHGQTTKHNRRAS